MAILIDKLILFLCCMLPLYQHTPVTTLFHVLAALTAIIFICLCSLCNLDGMPFRKLPKAARGLLLGLWGILAGISICSPVFGFLLPLLFYELAFASRNYIYFAACFLPFFSLREEPAFYPQIELLLFVLAFLLSYKTKKLIGLEQNLHLLRDTSTENALLLQQKNKDLIERQNQEIHIATLRERNRIAREIHDNVGHMLSRSILQAGALSALNQQENLKIPLNDLSATLLAAMTSVRESVHNLHDDSIDLKAAICDLSSNLSDYHIHFTYDMGNFVPAPVKYCFISITKEALSNIVRHSNGTDITITLREHPSLYQLIIKDNGTNIVQNSAGMGIANMQERVKHLNGNFSTSTENGFQIFASVPHT